jgi:two-component system cell cycle response regulator
VAKQLKNLNFKFQLFSENCKLKNEIENLKHLVHSDDLTGLGNVRRLSQDIQDLLAKIDSQAIHKNKGPSVIFIDLDHFKNINQNHGHLAASEILKRVARRLNRVFRETDKIYRYGGDEFVVLVPEGGPSAAQIISKRILTVISQTPFAISGFKGPSKVHVTASIGIRVLRSGDSAEALLLEADRALFEAKKHSRNTAVLSAA